MKITANNGKQVFEHLGLCTDGNIDKLIVYGNGKKYVEIDTGRIEPKFTNKNKFGNMELSTKYYYSIDEIKLTGEVKRANKENLTRKDNYLLRINPERGIWYRRTIYALYIHESDCRVIDMGEMIANQTDDETDYLHAYALTFTNRVIIKDAVFDRIVCDDFTFPEGARIGDGIGTKENPVYEWFDTSDYCSLFEKKTGKKREPQKGVFKKWWNIYESPETILVTVGPYCRMEYSDRRKEADNLAKIISDAIGHRLSHYDIEKLQKVVDIKVKEA